MDTITDDEFQAALEKFLRIPPPAKAVRIIKLIIRNLIQKPEEVKFQSLVEAIMKRKFTSANVPWDLTVNLLVAIGFSPEIREDGKRYLVELNLARATTLLQLVEDFQGQRAESRLADVQDDAVLQRMHNWALGDNVEAELAQIVAQIKQVWDHSFTEVVEFFSVQNSKMNQAIMGTALQALIKNHTEAQAKNWPSEKFMQLGLPEFNVDFLLKTQDTGSLGVQVLVEEILSKDFSAVCFKKIAYVYAQAGQNNMEKITATAGARKVALIQLAQGLFDFFTTYRENLAKKMMA